MIPGPSSRQQSVKPLQVHATSTNVSGNHNTSHGRIPIEKAKPSVNFIFMNATSKSAASTNATSPKADLHRRQNSRIEEIQPHAWEKTEKHIKMYNNLMNANRVKSPQFHADRRGSMATEVDDSDLKLKVRFDTHSTLRARDFGSSISTLKNPERGMDKPIVENVFNEQPMKILDVRKHNLETYNFKPEAVKHESAAERVPKEFTHQKRDEKILDIPTRKRHQQKHHQMFYKKFYYG